MNSLLHNEYVWLGVVIGVLVIAYLTRRWFPFMGLVFDLIVFGSLVFSITVLAYFRYKGWL